MNRQEETSAYLPGAGLFLRPFFLLPDSVGLGLFILLDLALGLWLSRMLLDAFVPGSPGGGVRISSWHYLWIWPPIHLSIQNNQLTVCMAALVVAALLRLDRGRKVAGGVFLALAAAFKTLPLALVPFLVLRRNWKPVSILVFGTLLISLIGFWALHGSSGLLQAHLDWPGSVVAQDPLAILDAGSAGRFFGDNMSVRAFLVRSASWLGSEPARWACNLLFWGSLGAASWVTLRRRSMRWIHRIALWLAWIALAAPYGRYYYTVLFLPAWMTMAMARVPVRGGASKRWLVWFGRLGPPLALATKTHGAYPILAVLTFAALLFQLAPETERATTRILLPSENPSRSRL